MAMILYLNQQKDFSLSQEYLLTLGDLLKAKQIKLRLLVYPY
jgi:hypothetical protein